MALNSTLLGASELGRIFAVAGFTVFFSSLLVLPCLILRPIIHRAKNSPVKQKSRFSILDLLSLIFLIQLPAVLINSFDFKTGQAATPMVCAMIASGLCWIVGVRAINHLGINNAKKRLTAVALVFPIAISSGFICVGVFNWILFETIYEVRYVEQSGIVLPSICLLVVFASCFAAFKLSQWIAKPETETIESEFVEDPLA